MRNAAADYAIPRSRLAEAKLRDAKFNSTAAVAELVEQARRTFTDLGKTGEGGEMLLFLLAERFLKLPHILCKMDLKTDTRMHYHGADGVYAGVASDGKLKLFWGESKIYKSPDEAIKECLKSLAPFLTEADHADAERERDLVLLSDKADLSNPELTAALRRYFNRNSVMSNRVQYCGVALVGFDAAFYPGEHTKSDNNEIAKAAKAGLKAWSDSIEKGIRTEKLEQIEIQLLCLPLPSAQDFRDAFLKAMGLGK
jgi:hypothetical protein